MAHGILKAYAMNNEIIQDLNEVLRNDFSSFGLFYESLSNNHSRAYRARDLEKFLQTHRMDVPVVMSRELKIEYPVNFQDHFADLLGKSGSNLLVMGREHIVRKNADETMIELILRREYLMYEVLMRSGYDFPLIFREIPKPKVGIIHR